jgi:hypothetical protein
VSGFPNLSVGRSFKKAKAVVLTDDGFFKMAKEKTIGSKELKYL